MHELMRATDMVSMEDLEGVIRRYPSVLLAFSGGVDSTFLAAVARRVLGREHLLLVTATSSTYPQSERRQAEALAGHLDCTHMLIDSGELAVEGFAHNTPLRCYHCKHELFGKMTALARQRGCAVVFDGSTREDCADFRPGMRAKNEWGVVSPLMEAGFTKLEIRHYSAKLNLPTAAKGSFACLASRFPYGETITAEKLHRVGQAEEALRIRGFVQMRVRSHGDLARIELGENEMARGWAMRSELDVLCREAGFVFVALDCRPYRTGAMNEALDDAQKDAALRGRE